MKYSIQKVNYFRISEEIQFKNIIQNWISSWFQLKKIFKTGFFLGFNSKKYSFNTKKRVPPTPNSQTSPLFWNTSLGDTRHVSPSDPPYLLPIPGHIKPNKRTHQHLETHFLLLWFLPPSPLPHFTFIETKFPRPYCHMAYYPNLHVLFAQNYAYFFTCFREELKTILYNCEQLLIRMSSIWESSCLNQIWQRQNLWISIQYRLKIKLFHLLLDFLLFSIIKIVLQIISSPSFPSLLWWKKMLSKHLTFPPWMFLRQCN